MADGFTKGQMKSARKYEWDEGFYLARSDPERVRARPIEPDKLPRFKKQPFDFEACRAAWAAVNVIANEKRIREYMKKLERWREQRTKGKTLIRIKKFKLNSD